MHKHVSHQLPGHEKSGIQRPERKIYGQEVIAVSAKKNKSQQKDDDVYNQQIFDHWGHVGKSAAKRTIGVFETHKFNTLKIGLLICRTTDWGKKIQFVKNAGFQ